MKTVNELKKLIREEVKKEQLSSAAIMKSPGDADLKTNMKRRDASSMEEAGKAKETEHAGAKKGKGAYWGPKKAAKKEAKKLRREKGKKEAKKGELEEVKRIIRKIVMKEAPPPPFFGMGAGPAGAPRESLEDRIANDLVDKTMKRVVVLRGKGHDPNKIIRRMIIKLKGHLR